MAVMAGATMILREDEKSDFDVKKMLGVPVNDHSLVVCGRLSDGQSSSCIPPHPNKA